jgi:ABC-type sugar transport system substrate-binding protein
MSSSIARRHRALWLSAGVVALGCVAAQAAPLVKECAKDGKFVIGFSQANNAEPYRAHVNDELTAAAKAVPQFSRSHPDLALRGGAADPGRRPRDEGRHSRHRARP